MNILPIFSNIVKKSNELFFTVIKLDEWSFVKITGRDNVNYLQSQLTIDVIKLKKNVEHLICAHCNSLGKVWSTMRIFPISKDNLGYILRKNIARKQVNELKKYSIFSDVKIKIDNSRAILGISGLKCRDILSKIFDELPNKKNTVIFNENFCILWIKNPLERFLIISNKEILYKIQNKFSNYNYNNSQWIALEIESGFPIIDNINSEKYLPQEINLHNLSGISFDKGCYLGQEIISKTQFLNLNRKIMHWLSGHCNYLPKSGEKLQGYENKKWYFAGTVLSAVKISTRVIWIQAILNKKFLLVKKIRAVNDQNSNFKIINILSLK